MNKTQGAIDWNQCLEISNNKAEVARELLEMLAIELPSTLKQMQACLQQGELNHLSEIAHKLHGACCYTGVPRLKALLDQMEEDISNHQTESLNQQLVEIADEINNILSALKEKTLTE